MLHSTTIQSTSINIGQYTNQIDHTYQEDINRYQLLSEEIKRLEAFGSDIDPTAMQQMRMEKMVLQQFLISN